MAKREVGRPSSYRPEFCDTVRGSAVIMAKGVTDQSIAEILGVQRFTIFRWREEHPEFAEACSQASEAANDVVEGSLFQRANGYQHEAVKIFMPAGAAAPVYAPYTERYAPDTGAATMWLKNRRRGRWQDRVEMTGADGGPVQIEQTNTLEIAKAIGLALRMAAERIAKPGDGAKVIEATAGKP